MPNYIRQTWRFVSLSSAKEVCDALKELEPLGVTARVDGTSVIVDVPEEHSEAIQNMMVETILEGGGQVIPMCHTIGEA